MQGNHYNDCINLVLNVLNYKDTASLYDISFELFKDSLVIYKITLNNFSKSTKLKQLEA